MSFLAARMCTLFITSLLLMGVRASFSRPHQQHFYAQVSTLMLDLQASALDVVLPWRTAAAKVRATMANSSQDARPSQLLESLLLASSLRLPHTRGHLLSKECVQHPSCSTDAVLASQLLAQRLRPRDQRGVGRDLRQRRGEGPTIDLADLREAHAGARLRHHLGVPELVEAAGRHDAGAATPQGGGRGAGAAVVDDGRTLREQPLVGSRLDEEDALVGKGQELLAVRLPLQFFCTEPRPATQHHAPESSLLQRAHCETRHVLWRDREHGTPADVHRRTSACHELRQHPEVSAAEGCVAIRHAPLLLGSGDDPEACEHRLDFPIRPWCDQSRTHTAELRLALHLALNNHLLKVPGQKWLTLGELLQHHGMLAILLSCNEEAHHQAPCQQVTPARQPARFPKQGRILRTRHDCRQVAWNHREVHHMAEDMRLRTFEARGQQSIWPEIACLAQLHCEVLREMDLVFLREALRESEDATLRHHLQHCWVLPDPLFGIDVRRNCVQSEAPHERNMVHVRQDPHNEACILQPRTKRCKWLHITPRTHSEDEQALAARSLRQATRSRCRNPHDSGHAGNL
mmetsp:Transcript_56441/g.182814  ORF Transcript_56441/g.182814 Transcript_56441/m.182814 type:complete len:574 (+) Transcript_56441:184-1905(+)